MAELLFYLLAAGAIAFGVGVVVSRMPLFSVLNLLGAFFCLAGIYLLAGFQFLAATQLLVYVGAIMVLFLFVIMLLNLGDTSTTSEELVRGKRIAIACATAGLLTVVGLFSIGWGKAYELTAEQAEHGLDPLQPIAEVLFSRYALPFEAASLLLLATMVSVIVLAKRQRTHEGASEAAGEAPHERAGWPWEKGVEQP